MLIPDKQKAYDKDYQSTTQGFQEDDLFESNIT